MATLFLQPFCSDAKTKDGEPIPIDTTAIRLSTVLVDAIAHCDDDECIEFPVLKFTRNILLNVVEWMTHHKNDPEQLQNQDNGRIDDVSSWDKQFLGPIKHKVYDILVAADYLEIPGLVTVVSKFAANMIVGKTPAQIRSALNIEND